MPTTVAYSDVKFLRKWIRSAIFGEKARGVKDAKMESKLTNVANSVFRDMAVLDQASIRSNIRPAVVDNDLFHIIRELAKARWKKLDRDEKRKWFEEIAAKYNCKKVGGKYYKQPKPML